MSSLAPSAAANAMAPWRTSFGPVHLFHSAHEIAPDIRERAFRGQCKDLRFYQLVEETMPGQFEYRYLSLENSADGEVAIQPLFYVKQDLLAGLPPKLHAIAVAVRRRWPRFLMMRMLMIGSASGEGHLDSTAPWIAKALHEALEEYLPKAGASIVLLKDFPASYRESLSLFAAHGYRRVASMPGARLKLDFPDFETFLQSRLSKVFRKNLRRKFRVLEGKPPITMEVRQEVASIAGELHALYLQTHFRSRLRFEQLTEAYLVEAGRRLPDRVRFFIWRQEGRIIAFSLCMVHEGTLYDLDVGMDYRVALELHLYFVTWRDVIGWCLQNGVEYYYTGPLNYDPKLHLRMRLAPLDLYARHTSPYLNPFFKVAIHFLQPARHDPLLKQFPNASEL